MQLRQRSDLFSRMRQLIVEAWTTRMLCCAFSMWQVFLPNHATDGPLVDDSEPNTTTALSVGRCILRHWGATPYC